MRTFFKLFILSAMSLAIANCSTISKEECEVGDWAGIGESDASKGMKKDRFYKYVKECKEYGYEPDIKLYKTGYSKGLKTYCTAENGWQLGKSGASYKKICPKSLARAFETSYEKGRQIYKLNSQINGIEGEVRDIDTKIEEHQNNMVAGGKTGPEVAMLAIQVDKLRSKQKDLEKKKRRIAAKVKRLDTESALD